VIFDQNSYDTIQQKGFKGFFDQPTVDNLVRNHDWRSRALDPFGELMEIELARSMEAGAAWKADSIPELETAIGFPGRGVFANEVSRYQQMIAQGRDTDFGKNPIFLIPLNTPPYYAVRMEPAIFGTLGGIRVDHFMRVMDTNLKPIPGLYAAGQDSGDMFGWPYYDTAGSTQSYAYNSGRIAGESAFAGK
jgi:fumarate reductase flavoprotein subunit